MTRKYTPPKKKKSHQAVHTRSPESAPSPVAKDISVVNASSDWENPAPAAAVDTVQYTSLPKELRRVALFSAVTLAIMIVLWLVLR